MRRVLTLSLPPRLLEKVERLAKKENRNKSELFREALRRYIEEKEWQDVLKYARRKARQQGILSEPDVERIVDEARYKVTRA
jgi:metal-responsive CopG/Arc/MetJ family transcriptional regulator